MDKHLVKINLPGGFTSAGDLYEILLIAENAGARNIRFGNRQQLYFGTQADCLEDMGMEMLKAGINYEIDSDLHPNIISSYIADTIFSQEGWLREGVFKDILDMFDYQPRLKINLVDSQQTFVPFFTGNLNFISSDVSNYWYLYVRHPKTNLLYCWPSFIYSDDIPGISKEIEDIIYSNKQLFYDQPRVDSKHLYKLVTDKTDFVIQQVNHALKVPEFHLPYYEGFNKHGNKYWLGIYRRDELFLIDFLKDICNLCMQTRVGQVYISPWKSVLIKSIEAPERGLWGNLLNKYKVNVRHASNELNWQVEDLCDYCLDLKKQLVKEFEEADLRTYRLSFAIKRTPKSGLFGSIIIMEQQADRFEIVHTRDFNPNSKDFIVYKQNVLTDDLSRYLITLCNEFYNMQSNINQVQSNKKIFDQTLHVNETKKNYQCKNCLTIYDEDYGDEFNGVIKGTSFEGLNRYTCPTCGSAKEDFICVERSILLTSNV